MALVSAFTGEQAAAEAAMRLRGVSSKVASLQTALRSYGGPNGIAVQGVTNQTVVLAEQMKAWTVSLPSKTLLGNLFKTFVIPGYPLGVGILALLGKYKTDAQKYGTSLLQQVLIFEDQSEDLCMKAQLAIGNVAGCAKLPRPMVPKEETTIAGTILWYGFLGAALYIGGKYLLGAIDGRNQRHPSPPKYAR